MPDSSAVDSALSAKLLGDATLMALMTDGVWFDQAGDGKTKFVIISLVDEHDEPMFGARAFEDALYLVKAVALSTTSAPLPSATIVSAAARIDSLLEGQSLAITGYSLMTMRRESRVRFVEPDDVDSTIRWHHRGGRYQIVVSS